MALTITNTSVKRYRINEHARADTDMVEILFETHAILLRFLWYIITIADHHH